jgi:hypothetical protein
VLQLGVGTGATFAHYSANLASLTGLDICGMPDPGRLFAEIWRVLRPGG